MRIPGSFAASSATAAQPAPPTSMSTSPPSLPAAVTALNVAAHTAHGGHCQPQRSQNGRSGGPQEADAGQTGESADQASQQACAQVPGLSAALLCSATTSVDAKRALHKQGNFVAEGRKNMGRERRRNKCDRKWNAGAHVAQNSKRGSATHNDTYGPAQGLTARQPPSRRSERLSAPGAERRVAC